MIRTSKHILKYQNKEKDELLLSLFNKYQKKLQEAIDFLWEDNELKNKKQFKVSEVPRLFGHSKWNEMLFKKASEIIRSNIKRKRTSKPTIKSNTIPIDKPELVDFSDNCEEFDEFIRIKLPFMNEKGTRSKNIKLPFKNHKQSNKFKKWDRKNTIKLKKEEDKIFLILFHETKEPNKKQNGDSIGMDMGYKKLIATSEGYTVGDTIEKIYEKISKKQQGSINFKTALNERDSLINEYINNINFNSIKTIYIEKLKDVKKNSKGKIYKKFNNKLQRWSYNKTINKLKRICEEQGIEVVEVPPQYTSRTCSKCGYCDKNNRNKELFHCNDCGYENDADINAAINIHNKGECGNTVATDRVPLPSKG